MEKPTSTLEAWLTLLEAEVSLTGNEWEKHPIVTGPEAPCILGIDYLRKGYFKDPKGYRWAFGIAALEAEEIEPLSTLPGLSEDPSVVELLRVEEQQVPIATTTVHQRQYHTNRDSLVPIHKLIHQLEGQGVISRTHSPFNSPIWPVWKSNGEWRLTVDYRGLNEVTPPMSAAVPDMLELQYELESKAAKWYATMDIANAFFSIPLVTECRPQFAFTWRGVQYTWNGLPQGWKHSPTICHGVIQTALEKGEAPEHLQYIDDIIVWGNSAAEEVSEKGKKIIQILLQAGFAIKQSKVKGPAQEIQFLGIRWHDGRRQIPMDIINKRAAMSPPTNKKETQAFLGVVGFWRMHIPNDSLVRPLYQMTRKKNDFKWGPEQQQAFEQIKQEIVHAVALGSVWAGPDVKNVLYTAAGENSPTWSLWQKTPGETRGRPLRCRTEYENRNEAAKGDDATRKQFHAFVLFLAELYLNLEIKGTKGQVTRAEILQEGLRELLNVLFSNPVDNNLICAVKLLKLTGSVLEDAWKEKGKHDMEEMIQKIENVVLDANCSR
ncbi:hypothetical protein GRJ2_003416500 [Grus japonensis]|uniref:ribonuclease H n=1 Tax=Grus japonensis TaxID=30415 RepID=A0ABC9YHH6_GRUJA